VIPWTSGFNDHFILNSDVKREELVEFGPLGYSGQEKKLDLLKQTI
jgi:hypothetical protein